MAFDSAGNLYVASGGTIVRIAPDGATTNFVTGLNQPLFVAVEPDYAASAIERAAADFSGPPAKRLPYQLVRRFAPLLPGRSHRRTLQLDSLPHPASCRGPQRQLPGRGGDQCAEAILPRPLGNGRDRALAGFHGAGNRRDRQQRRVARAGESKRQAGNGVVRMGRQALTSRMQLAQVNVGSGKGLLCRWACRRAGQPPASLASSGSPLRTALGIVRGAVQMCGLGRTVVAWGDNFYGQTNLPGGLSNVVAVAGGGSHSLALRSDGKVVAWGYNQYGQTNVPPMLDNVVAVAGGTSHSLALRNDGTVVAWGQNTSGQTNVPAGLGGVVAVAAGGSHSLALQSDGTVVAWGNNYYGQSMPAGLGGVVAIAAGGSHSLALRSDGKVVAWGSNTNGQTAVPANLSNVVAIAAGNNHSLALRNDGTVVAWGQNTSGQTNVPAGLGRVVGRRGGGFAQSGVAERRQGGGLGQQQLTGRRLCRPRSATWWPSPGAATIASSARATGHPPGLR